MAHHRLASRKGALRLAALGAAAALTTALLPGQAASAAPSAFVRQPREQHLPEAARLRDGRGRPGALDGLPEDRGQQHRSGLPGTRAAGTDGYADSVEYVAGLLREAGYKVTLDPVEITFNFPAVLRQLTPIAADYETGVFTGSGSGEVEGNVIPIDINLTRDRRLTSGCEAADFAGIDWSGDNDIALVQRGTCFFGTKAYYAEQAGAEAVIIFNQGNTPERRGADRRGRDERGPADPRGPRTGHARHPRGGRELRRWGRAGAAGFHSVRRGAAG